MKTAFNRFLGPFPLLYVRRTTKSCAPPLQTIMPTPFSRAEIFPVENGPEDFRKFDVVSVSGSVLTGTADLLNGKVQQGYACPCFVSPDDVHEDDPEFHGFPFRMIEFAVGGTFTPKAFECLEQFSNLEVVVVRSNAWNKDWEYKMDTLSSLWNSSKTTWNTDSSLWNSNTKSFPLCPRALVPLGTHPEKLKLPNLKLLRLFDGPRCGSTMVRLFDAARKNRPGLRIVHTRTIDPETSAPYKPLSYDPLSYDTPCVQVKDTWCPSAADRGGGAAERRGGLFSQEEEMRRFGTKKRPVHTQCDSKWLGRMKPGFFCCAKWLRDLYRWNARTGHSTPDGDCINARTLHYCPDGPFNAELYGTYWIYPCEHCEMNLAAKFGVNLTHPIEACPACKKKKVCLTSLSVSDLQAHEEQRSMKRQQLEQDFIAAMKNKAHPDKRAGSLASGSSAVGTGGLAGVKKGGSSKASRKLY